MCFFMVSDSLLIYLKIEMGLLNQVKGMQKNDKYKEGSPVGGIEICERMFTVASSLKGQQITMV